MSKISDIIPRQILDSRGNPTIEVDVVLSNGIIGRASVPSGASKGKYESLELRDNSGSYHGLSVRKALDNIETEISDVILGRSCLEQSLIDKDLIELDGTKNKQRLGANSILGVSLAVCKAASTYSNMHLWQYLGGINCNKLPVPMMNIINGGAHANNQLDVQEIMIMPIGFDTFKEALMAGSEIFNHLKKILNKKNLSTSVGDEGGFAPNIKDTEEALSLISSAVEKAKYEVGKHIFFSLDAAANEFFKEGKYQLFNNTQQLNSSELLDYWLDLARKFPIISIEDPFQEDDFDSFSKLTSKVQNKVQIVGDDLFVTSSSRLQNGIDLKSGNSILIKFNQVGTLTETLETINLAQTNNFNTIVSHRSGETEDNFISDLSVGVNAGQIKTGSLSRSDRTSKYNQLLRIEELLGDNAIYSGYNILKKIRRG